MTDKSTLTATNGDNRPFPNYEVMPDPTDEMLASPQFEAIWSVIKSWDVNVPEAYSGYCGANGSHVAMILRALSASPFPPPSAGVDAVAVKALEWSEIERDRGDGQTDRLGEWEASSIVGVYAINISTCGDMHAPWEVFGGDDSKIGNFATLDEAKAAAQADYEARIRSALTPAPTHVEAGGEAEPVAWQWRHKSDKGWRLSWEKPFNPGIELRPLYTLAKPAPAVEAVREDAERWRALMSSQRMHMMGSFGFDYVFDPPDSKKTADLVDVVPRAGDHMHFGIEFWSEHSAYGDPAWPDDFPRKVLTTYVDEMRRRAALAPAAQAGTVAQEGER
jgi:hypothetical protein